MSLTCKKVAETAGDGVRVIYCIATPGSSFTAGGETIDPRSIGLQTVIAVFPSSVPGYLLAWNNSTTTPKLQAFMDAGGTSGIFTEASTKDLSALPIPFIIIGH